ncbi:BT_3044 domain-containing protein [Mucilaginibacter flavidus]|uniref:BT_3044 domain-containing protein n=1 Tax=Mucilaginibacter flavidus TaxID=2949309 RepID=UPI002093B10B|nr:DUF4361 domain-containing protein [Mucilaginibacter flavidus]MCO5950949.1 DUF4361 domain-containing protein [Mucilaginibacter flavidus]
MKNKFLQYTLIGCSVMTLFSACRKDPFSGTETKQSGKSYVYITEAQENDLHFLPFTDIKTVTVFSLRRDAASNADLQKSASIVLTSLDLAAYNAANSTDYTPIPTTLATQTADPSIVSSASGVTFNLAPGVFAKNYSLDIDGSKFDPSKKYAVLLAITNFNGYSKMHAANGVALDTILVTLGVKNIYDGVYHAAGLFTRYAADLSQIDQRVINQDKTLGTVDAATVSSTVADLGDGDPITLKVNADNSVTVTFVGTSLSNLPGPFTQVGDNFYDPATKTFTLHYQYRGKLRTTEETLTLKQ